MLPEIIEHVLHEKLKGYEMESHILQWELNGYQRRRLKGIRKEIREFAGSSEQLIQHLSNISEVNILLVHIAPVTIDVIKACKNLSIIGCLRANPVNVDIDAATLMGIPVLNTPGRNATAVAEFVIGAIIAYIRNIAKASTLLKNGQWKYDFYYYEHAGFELNGKTLGIIGFGQVGREVAKRAVAFGMNILVYDPYVQSSFIESFGAKSTTLEHLLRESDILSVHCVLTEETYHLIGEKQLRMMKPNAIIVNTARGGIIDESALVLALEKKIVAGAILDVFEDEPLPPDSPLLKLENVMVTPHIAGAAKDVVYRASSIIAEDIKRMLEGQKPLHCINPHVLI
ncbi:MAG: 2-hydroxyacid dehydrogenase [Nitrososphaerota archaeon]